MLTELDPVSRLIIVSGKMIIFIIIVGRVQKCVVCEMYEVRYSLKGKLIFITNPMCIFINAVRGPKPKQEVIYLHLDRINSQIKNIMCASCVPVCG